jgi:hydroxyacylglutathione hydrolase
MISVKNFVFNPFGVNTFILSDETKDCVIIDPACYDDAERKALTNYIEVNKLKPVRMFNTHCHVDHILGNAFISGEYHLPAEIHKAGLPLIGNIKGYGLMFGLNVDEFPLPEKFVDEDQIIKFGKSSLKVLYLPGHADGSIAFYSEEGFVFVGDVLFNGSIGRTDLPSGNHEMLLKNIEDKLFTLPAITKVYCGHGPETTIGFEKENNPFFE